MSKSTRQARWNFERLSCVSPPGRVVETTMRALVALIIIIYLVGVGVALSPTIRANWNSAPASDLAASVGQDLPYALAWPARVYHSITDRG